MAASVRWCGVNRVVSAFYPRLPGCIGVAARGTGARAASSAAATHGESRPPWRRAAPAAPAAAAVRLQHAMNQVPGSDRLSFPRVVSLVGAPMWLGQPIDGTDKAPALLRARGLVKDMQRMGWRVKDHGDVKMPVVGPDELPDPRPGDLYANNCVSVGRACRNIYKAAREGAKAGQFTLVLGGDHSIAVGSVAAALAANPDVGILWVDAHADLNVPNESPSGNMHGMPVGLLTRMVDPERIPGFEWLADTPPLKPEQMVYIGLRDIDIYERRVIPELGIPAYTMEQIDRFGIGDVMEHACQHLKGRPLHLSYDIDACDPTVAPATGTRVPGGLNFREALYVAESAARTMDLVSMDLVEVNPEIDDADDDDVERTVDMARRIIRAGLGQVILPDPFHNVELAEKPTKRQEARKHARKKKHEAEKTDSA